jgi:hypothetical protein
MRGRDYNEQGMKKKKRKREETYHHPTHLNKNKYFFLQSLKENYEGK